MKTMLKFFTFVAVLFGFSSISFAQGTQSTASASATAAAGGRIIQPLTLIATKALEFGDIIKGQNTVTVAANGSRTATNTDLLLTLTGGKTPQAAEFEIEGEPGLAYVVTYESNVVLNGPDNSATMSVESFTTNATLTLPNSSTEGTTAGKDTFNVGASLTVSADQKPGVYEGTFTVTVNYN